MKRISLMLTTLLGLILFSCNNNEVPLKKPKQPIAVAAATTPAAEVKPAFTPFKVVAIQHKVKNFDKAVAGYFSRDSLLKAYGITHFVFARDMKDSNQVFAIDKIEDVKRLNRF
jgi:hypothetical protein